MKRKDQVCHKRRLSPPVTISNISPTLFFVGLGLLLPLLLLSLFIYLFIYLSISIPPLPARTLNLSVVPFFQLEPCLGWSVLFY